MFGVILFFLGAAVLLYVLFGGADFGAGILEIFAGRTRRDAVERLIGHAMAPVWEANHVWLILAVVILFMAFPTVYTTISVHLFLPIVAILIGIVARGTAFTFRHYDPVGAGWHPAYGHVFAWASLWTSAWLGVTAGAMVGGGIDPSAADTWGLYIAPWANLFCLTMAVFTSALFSLLAAVFLVGEAGDAELVALFRGRAKVAAGILVLTGAAVFGAAELSAAPLLGRFFAVPLSVASFVLATALLWPFWRSLGHGRTRARVLAVAIVTLVLFGWFAVQYPVAIRLAHGAVTFPEAASPPATQRALVGALVVGSLVIFPGLGWLYTVFKRETFARG
jgi:cytochrome d ubiquinol oxidase subunit II